ncbi:hypothetical protein [Streptomyces sp. NPDC086777]|uniref:hypothetical protein n=1 Tax=Streptomyces sp. NPDC086777 TaxID=3154866 RepID=UPI00344CA435
MTKLFLSLHVLAAITAVGPVAVATSMFPASLRRIQGDSTVSGDGLRILHRICRVYAAGSLTVPALGMITAQRMHVLGSPWLSASIILTVLAAVVLFASVALQERALHRPAQAAPGQLAGMSGVFNLLWAAVTVLMIVRPGSTTGA